MRKEYSAVPKVVLWALGGGRGAFCSD